MEIPSINYIRSIKKEIPISPITQQLSLYDSLLTKIVYGMQHEAELGNTEFQIKICNKYCESDENKEMRQCLEDIKVRLRYQGYQTSWQYDVLEDDGFDRKISDIFRVSWDPKIKWNQFRD